MLDSNIIFQNFSLLFYFIYFQISQVCCKTDKIPCIPTSHRSQGYQYFPSVIFICCVFIDFLL